MRDLFGVIAIRGFGVVFSAITAMLSLRVFLAADPNNAATFVGFIGWLVFVPLAQMGFGRPCYAEVRSRSLGGSLDNGLVTSFIQLFMRQGVAAALCFGALSVGFGLAQGYTGVWSALVIFAIGMAAIAVCTLQRDLAYALDMESAYESLETGRRAASVLVYLGIWQGISLQVMGLFALMIGMGTFLYLNRLLKRRAHAEHSKEVSGDGVTHWHRLQPKIGSKARRYFGFSINEVVFYNTPLIMFTFYPVPGNVIYFGVWSKLFLLLVLPVRIFIDTRMNHVTALYFGANRSGAWWALIRCLQVGMGLVVPALVMLFFWQEELLTWLNAHQMRSDPWLWVSLALWACGNIVQHTYGTFTISYQDGFSFAYLNSLIGLFLVSGTMIGVYLITQNLGQSLAWAGGMYILSALVYVSHVFRVTRVDPLVDDGD
jgi:hypothetical protein